MPASLRSLRGIAGVAKAPPLHSAEGARTARRGHRFDASVRSFAATALALTLALLPATRARGGDELAPYRALAGTPRARTVLAAARAAIARYFDPSAPAPADSVVPDWPGPPAGLYVSLLRGTGTRACVGSLTPLAGTLAENLRQLAPQAVSADPRRPPVRREELAALRLVVAFAGRGEPVADPMLVRPSREGLLITTAKGSVAFLPGEARTVAWALREARRIGILGRTSDAGFQRFAVVVLKEDLAPVEEDHHASP